MSIQIKESYDDRRVEMDQNGKYKSYEQTYLVFGAEDECEAVSAVRNMVSKTMYSLPLDNIELKSRCSEDIFKVIVSYSEQTYLSETEEEEETPTLSFDCGTGTRHVSKSIKQTRIFGNMDAGGMIGWNGKSGGDKEVAGVDVPAPQLRATYTRKMRLANITESFIRNAAALVGCVNSVKFKNWQPGEVMFLGWSYSAPLKGAKYAMVTFSFAIQMNEVVTISGSTTYNKKGHDYIWTLTRTVVDQNGLPQVVPDSIFIEQVAKYADFSILGL